MLGQEEQLPRHRSTFPVFQKCMLKSQLVLGWNWDTGEGPELLGWPFPELVLGEVAWSRWS